METRRLIFLGAAILILSLASLFVFSQLDAQNNMQQLAQADFVNILIRALGLEDEFGVTATMMDKVKRLEELGLAPPGGWDLERPLLKGDAAIVLAQILGIKAPPGATPEEYVHRLADQNIMVAGEAEKALSQSDLTTAINTAAAPPWERPPKERSLEWSEIPLYRIPVSPTGWRNAPWLDDDGGGD